MVLGSTFFTNAEKVHESLDEINTPENKIDVILHGGETGVSTYAVQWAEKNQKQSLAFKPNWQRDGNKARPMRDVAMVQHGKPDLVVLFPGSNTEAIQNFLDSGLYSIKIL